eukprot:XP_016657851.1 PREDICTED: uncharacterized protein LOC100573769 isoform X2 [Acyrthosiphon pisum]
MYADDSIMCCLFPNRCNSFPQTPVVIFSSILEYINMIIVLISPIFIVWSLLRIVQQFGEVPKLIDQNNSEDSCSEEQSPREDIHTNRTDECLSDENNSDGYGDKLCSDSDLNVSNSFQRRLEKQNGSSFDCYNSNLESSEEVVNIDMTNLSRRSSNSVRRNYSTTSDEREEHNHNMEHLEKHDYTMIAVHQSKLTVIDEDDLKFLNVNEDDSNNEQFRV